MELNANNSAQAVVFLEAAAPYDLGDPPQLQLGTLYPVYIRGQAQLCLLYTSCASARRAVMSTLRLVICFFGLAGAGAAISVSYTHLDVYKRQIENRSASM